MSLARDWWTRGSQPILKGEADIETADVAAQNITSECLSPNALRRSLLIPLPDLAAGTTAPLSSAYQIFTAGKGFTIASAYLTPMTSWVQTTLQTTPVGTLYAGDNAVGTVVIPTTNAPTRGTALPLSLTTSLVGISSGTVLTFGLPTATSNGMDAPGHVLQIDYDSTG